MARTFVMGDIHGAYKALVQVLERSGFDKKEDTLIQLGDVADGWSEVPECVEELWTIKNLIPLRGNHDVWVLNWFTSGNDPHIWLSQGGMATFRAYERLAEEAVGGIEEIRDLGSKHLRFWKNQKDWYIDAENRLFVHAGFDLTEGWEWSKTTSTGIPNSLEIHWNRDLAEFNTKSWPNSVYPELEQFKEIFIGHTKHNTTSFNTPEKKNIWNLDTGCGWKGKLTIMDVNTKEYWQSDNVLTLYPNERGRF